jgi:hypothetical protein
LRFLILDWSFDNNSNLKSAIKNPKSAKQVVGIEPTMNSFADCRLKPLGYTCKIEVRKMRLKKSRFSSGFGETADAGLELARDFYPVVFKTTALPIRLTRQGILDL